MFSRLFMHPILIGPNVLKAMFSSTALIKAQIRCTPFFQMLSKELNIQLLAMAEGVRIAIQNMTWKGVQGFQVEPNARFIVPDQGDLGFVHAERGLTYVEVALCGHMVPQFQ